MCLDCKHTESEPDDPLSSNMNDANRALSLKNCRHERSTDSKDKKKKEKKGKDSLEKFDIQYIKYAEASNTVGRECYSRSEGRKRGGGGGCRVGVWLDDDEVGQCIQGVFLRM